MRQIVIVLALSLAVLGCKNIEKLEPGNALALENQTNLESNVLRQLDNFEKLAKAQPSWTPEDANTFAEQKAVIIEQLVINYGWLLVVKEAVEDNDINPLFFGQVLERAPAWIADGKKIYDLIKDMSKKD